VLGAAGLPFAESFGRVFEDDGTRVRELRRGAESANGHAGALAVRGNDRVFFANSAAAGFFQRDAGGEWSRSDLGPLPEMAPGAIHFIDVAVDDVSVVLARRSQLARWNDGRWQELPLSAEDTVRACLSDGKEIFVQTGRNAILRVVGNQFVPTAQIPASEDSRVVALDRNGDGRLRAVLESGAVLAIG